MVQSESLRNLGNVLGNAGFRQRLQSSCRGAGTSCFQACYSNTLPANPLVTRAFSHVDERIDDDVDPGIDPSGEVVEADGSGLQDRSIWSRCNAEPIRAAAKPSAVDS